MFRRILVPTDGTERSTVALEAPRLAALGGGTLIGVHASPPPYVMAPELGLAAPIHDAWRQEREQLGQDAVAHIRRRAVEAGVPCETLLVTGLPPSEAIVRSARTVVRPDRDGLARARRPGRAPDRQRNLEGAQP
jgi:nucleotide-binding universal stress UspA family protein